MCGLIGYSSKAQSNTDKIASLMYHNSVKRGEDNTGFYTPETGVVKDNKKAEEFLALNNLPKSHLFIGHVRKGSVGGKMAENSHPFENENIVLAHNGTLASYHMLANKNGIPSTDFKVDSEVLAKIIDNNSKGDEGFTVLSEFEGAAALLFADKRDPELLYAYTNGERPLFYGYIKGSMYLSSTEESLKMIQCIDIKPIKPEYLYSIKGGLIKSEVYYARYKAPVQRWNGQTRTWENAVNSCANNACNITDTRPFHNNLTNVKFKDDYLTNLYAKAPDSDEFAGRWIRASKSFNMEYGGPANKPNIKVGEWYYIIDSMAANNFDIIIASDEDNNEVFVAKYHFDYKSMIFTDRYAIATQDIESKDKLVKLFVKGEYVALDKNEPSALETFECYHEETKKSYTVSTEYLRPITEIERNKVIQFLMEDDKPEVDKTGQRSLPVKVTTSKESDDKAYETWLLNNRQRALDNATEEPEVNESSVVEEAEYTMELEPDEELANRILEGSESFMEDIEELIDATSYEALKLKFAEFREYLNEAYNFKEVKNQIELDNIVDARC